MDHEKKSLVAGGMRGGLSALGSLGLVEASRCAVAPYGAGAKNAQMKAAVQRGDRGVLSVFGALL